ncbi:hypothetical protein ETB97_009893 [Aspergillus alliaceus]|uniref:Uncharacterized protein n=1 Tax=Petromyces alliaceus TaxID=209559 RepID=A0A5N6GE05_PETAA|nr:uncharacterized protein BDW43DRAFT_305640 [Aspergillus alliaceus]KAB8238733.1 hypothetical protein BDW43DRAFT_305640 [Aspergillus alliaceus]KAE8386970.1 hypothetical protein BDV23DRAFT_186752 [Aspergillus alliaceus]KAF5866736.1 hypothetical protein ETB97_009893 [Aspergillus burnettii]
MALVRDPAFWRRFSRAIHLDEEAKASAAENKGDNIYSDDWIQGQRKKRHRTILCGFLIFASFSIVLAAVVVVIWWFHAHNWLRNS